jgi:hypothetical protein
MALRVRLDRLDDGLVPAARRERFDFGNRGLRFQARREDLRRLARAHERARQDEVEDDAHLAEARNRFGKFLRASRRQGTKSIVGILRTRDPQRSRDEPSIATRW